MAMLIPDGWGYDGLRGRYMHWCGHGVDQADCRGSGEYVGALERRGCPTCGGDGWA